MTSKQVRVFLASGLLLVLCGGCFGNCVTELFDGATDIVGGVGGAFSGDSRYLIEADAGPSDAVTDAGME